MKLNWFYIFIGLLVALMFFITLRFFRGSRSSSVGIAQAREYRINAGQPALVREVRVVAGQQVKKGDLLVELTSNTLEMNIARLENRLTALRSEMAEKAKIADSEVAFTKAELGVQVEKLNSEIAQTESELRLNEKLTRQFSPADSLPAGENPVRVRLDALRQQRSRQLEAIAIKVKDILQEKETEQRLMADQAELLEKELQLLVGERRTLSKFASADGVVENIYVRQGEQVDAFTALLSVNPLHPTSVVAYLVGRKLQPAIGATVTVQSYENKSLETNGRVIGLGAVVALPAILQKSTAVPAFGREVFIDIPPQNGFASGEKVLVR